MQFRIDIQNVQAIKRLSFGLDLSQHKVIGVVGRNGVGKTTLIRSIRNLSQSDTFLKTAPDGIFSPDSTIIYSFNGDQVTFTFDEGINSLNCRENISSTIQNICAVELPIPHGDRFNFFPLISQMDRHIRRQVILEEYNRPCELVDFLCDIYSSNRFKSLIETRVTGNSYYSILLDDGRYVREDYLSSGEYFLIRLYRMMMSSARLIVIDEIDISLDAVAQVKLLKKIREYCGKFKCNVLFTTHSLAMMRTLNDDELYFMERSDAETTLTPVSYSYAKSLLFAFAGWDRYILTEDRVLQIFLETLIHKKFQNIFFRYKIVFVGGANQVVSLLERNHTEQFFSEPENVIAVLDGDQRSKKPAQADSIHFLPFDNVETAIHEYYMEDKFPHKLPEGTGFNSPKDLFHSLQQRRIMSAEQICEYICDHSEQALEHLVAVLREFLTPD